MKRHLQGCLVVLMIARCNSDDGKDVTYYDTDCRRGNHSPLL